LTDRRAAAAWAAGYVGLILAPLVAGWGADPFVAPRPWPLEFGVALGFLALTIATLQLALVSRVRPTSRRIGSDRLIAWHRGAGAMVLLSVLVHGGLLGGEPWRWLNPFVGPAGARWGTWALWAIVVVAGASRFRRRLGLSYERWRAVHVAGAALIVAGAIAHALAAGGYTASGAMRWVLAGYAALAAWLLAYRWIVRPWRLSSRPWEVTANLDAGASTRLLRLRPIGHTGVAFEAGQFAWLITGRSAFSVEQHPLSIASVASRAPGSVIEFAVKSLGDWSARVVPALAEGDRVWVDGPYGALTVRPALPGTRLVLIAGGIGIAPMRAILQTMAAEGDRRPVTLIYAAAAPARIAFASEIAALDHALRLDFVFVFEQPDPGWQGERGRVTGDLLRRHLGEDVARHEYIVCGPPGMIEDVRVDLRRLGVPTARVRTERFHLV
jgi:predicted ferric reductase